MRTGTLRRWVQFQRPVLARSPTGEVFVSSWEDAFACRAAIEPLSGREFMAASEFRADIDTRIRIRWRTDVSPTYRVLYGGQVFNILALLEQRTDHREIHCMCNGGRTQQGGNP
ncbi:phage head closure protein [Cupriavidus taiwanensis]|uniref:phage head closure protein n=1 Tax=Cupriavidus taiwanensis TaxID=164546 RepID=UPI000E18C2D8|nr:phage head closure protein [Cupriavidus taiwanensis]SPA17253.1 Phage head-tail adaptor [Cupriavidus taiwanensis]